MNYKKTNYYFAAILLAFCLSLTSCKDDDPIEVDNNIQLKINGLVNNAPLELNKTYFNSFNQRYEWTKVQFYISNVVLEEADGSTVPITEVRLYQLPAFDIPGSHTGSIIANVPSGDYTSIRFGLGLDETLNASDHTSFARNHPLSFAQNTHWGWANKYIFTKLEGNVSADAEGNDFELGFLYHIGLDSLYREITLPRTISVTNDAVSELNIDLHLDQIFDRSGQELDVVNENKSHTTNNFSLAEKVINNMANAFN